MSAVLASLLTGRASAESSTHNRHETPLARALFEEGVALGDREDWAAAADRFERAYALKPTAGIAFNWASALCALGKLTQASELLESVSRDAKASPELKAESRSKLSQIAPRRAHLTLHVDAGIGASSQVSVDGNVWPRAAWDVAVPVDPGAHVAVVSDGEHELSRTELSLFEGESRELDLSVAPKHERVEAPAEPAPTRRGPREMKETKPLYKSWVLWTCVGALAVGGAVAALVVTRDGSHAAPPVMGNTGTGVIQW